MKEYLLSAVPKIDHIPDFKHIKLGIIGVSEELHELESSFGLKSLNSEQIVERMKKLQAKIESIKAILIESENVLKLKPSDNLDLEERIRQIANALKK